MFGCRAPREPRTGARCCPRRFAWQTGRRAGSYLEFPFPATPGGRTSGRRPGTSPGARRSGAEPPDSQAARTPTGPHRPRVVRPALEEAPVPPQRLSCIPMFAMAPRGAELGLRQVDLRREIVRRALPSPTRLFVGSEWRGSQAGRQDHEHEEQLHVGAPFTAAESTARHADGEGGRSFVGSGRAYSRPAAGAGCRYSRSGSRMVRSTGALAYSFFRGTFCPLYR